MSLSRYEIGRLAAFVLLSLLHGSEAAFGCSCVEPAPPVEAATQADAVFVGRVTAMTLAPDPAPVAPGGEMAVVTLHVTRSWKGIDSPTVDVRTSWTCCLCGYGFHLGSSYLVYAVEQTGGLWTSACSRTRKLEDANDDLVSLGEVFRLVDWEAPP